MDFSPAEIAATLPGLTIRDEHRLRRRLESVRRAGTGLEELAAEVEAAARRVERRRLSVPEVRYPADLPIVQRRDDIAEAISGNQVVVVAGETGSGKTTQLPKMCLELGRGVRGLIGHTQPRRIAARSVAERIAEELGTEVGHAVGYAVRFTDRVSDATLVKLMTDGILLAELHRDRLLATYDTIIVDEAHERSLNIDFLLGYLEQLLPRRPDLKVIITSATIDTAKFAYHFGGAPVVDVSGRTYPVEVRYRAPADDRDQVQAITEAVDELSAEGSGDMLVFLSGEREIRDAADALRRREHLDVLPLYARLSSAEQHRVFAPHQGRRVVLATNIAETSLTVPGIRYVIDAGTARISRFNRRTKVQRLPIEPVSQASADQRAGRCGRLGPGICVRLYAEEDLASRPPFTEPEILRTNLASVILQMAALELGEVVDFPFVDPPDVAAVKDGVALLEELGALDPAAADPRARLTPLGRRLTRLPVDPRLGRMLLEAGELGCLSELLPIAAGLSIQDPRERPAEQHQAADEAHARFADARSDFLSILNLWRYLAEQSHDLSSNRFRKLCRAEFLNYLRVREWQDLHGQLHRATQELGLRANPSAAQPDHIHQALLSGLLSHIGVRDPDKPEYRGARGARFAIASRSAASGRRARWVMAAELVETNRMWARVVAPIDPVWAEHLGAHLVRRAYGDPRWDARRGAAVTDERVTLLGLPLVPARRIDYERVDPGVARELFVEHALVEGEWTATHPFIAHNSRSVDEVRRLEQRSRRALLVGRDVLVDFFGERVAEGITSTRQFDRWWARVQRSDPHRFDLSPEQLIDPAASPVRMEDFPDTWRHGNVDLPLSYVFDPGATDDGVSVGIALTLLHQIEDVGFDWQVPGLRAELVEALIRTLPRPVRRRFVPIAEHARAFVARPQPESGRLVDQLDEALRLATGEHIPPGSWDAGAVPAHLRVTFKVLSSDGQVLGYGKSLPDLQREWRGEARAAVARLCAPIEQGGMREWSFGSLPRCVERGDVRGYPALVDEGETVAIRVMLTEEEQRRAMWAGTSRLLALNLTVARRQLERRVGDAAKLALDRRSLDVLLDDSVTAAVDRLLAVHGGPAWDGAAFDRLLAAVRDEVRDTAEAVVTFAGRITATAAAIRGRVQEMTSPALQPALDDIRAQVATLVHHHFVVDVGAGRLPDVLRYLRAVDRRLDKLPRDVQRDTAGMRVVRQLTADLERAGGASAVPAADVEAVRWMIEELRVSLFAQGLGTSGTVSEQRIRRAIERLST